MSRTLVFGLWGQSDAISLDEVGKNLLVSCFLETVSLDTSRNGSASVWARLGTAGSVALGLHRDVPIGRLTSRSRLALGIGDDRWPVGVVGVEQHAAESLLVRLAAERASGWRASISGGAVGPREPRLDPA
jgi:hypothetical protein